MKVKCLILAVALLFPVLGTAYGEPSRIIEKAMNTPASVFDVFLFEMQEHWEKYFESSYKAYYRYSYSFVDNLLILRFSLTAEPDDAPLPLIEGFIEGSEKHKKEILAEAIGRLATQVAATIQDTPIRKGWSTNDFNEKEFREELVKRTVINMEVWHDSEAYMVVRDQYGKIMIDKVLSRGKDK